MSQTDTVICSLDRVTAENLLIALTNALQSGGGKKKKKKGDKGDKDVKLLVSKNIKFK